MPDDQDGMDNRRAKRVDYEVSVDLATDDAFFTGFVRNISNGGLFIASESPMELGKRVTVRFTIPTLPDFVEALGEVRWVRKPRPGTDAVGGMGVAFIDLDPKVEAALDLFIKQNDTIFYE